MANMDSPRSGGGDEANTDFGFPERLADHAPGYDRGVASMEDTTGESDQYPASADADVPRESLAARIAKAQQEGGRS